MITCKSHVSVSSLSFPKKVELLRRALKMPVVVCGIDHERNPPDFACTQKHLENPRLTIGCAHTDMVRLTHDVVAEMFKDDPCTFLQNMQTSLELLQRELHKLDNGVYEKTEESVAATKKNQLRLGRELSVMIRSVLNFMATRSIRQTQTVDQ